MKPRFSLRTLLVVITIVALLAWWQTSPARLADRLVSYIETGRYAEAEILLGKKNTITGKMNRTARREISAAREPATWVDWLKGVSRVRLVIVDSGGWDRYTISARIEVTRRGVRPRWGWRLEVVERGPALLPTTMGAIRQ
jgi:hypothetical protein